MTEQMKESLLKIAKILNEAEVTWGVGASLMLHSLGIVEEVNDIDIMVAIKDKDKAVKVLEKIANHIPTPQKDEYETRYFGTFEVDGTDLDVMSGFRIKHSDGVYEFPMDEQSVVKNEVIDGIRIPYTSLEDWLVAYMIMIKRESKVKLITDYFGEEGVAHPELLERALEQDLPEEIRKKINKYL
jgi:hypothetical protein